MVIGGVVRAGFAAIAKLRGARVFHPVGVTLTGVFRAEGELTALIGPGERRVIARLSKGIGTPGAWPDVLGLALRTEDLHDQPWDFTLASTGSSTLGRLTPVVPQGWASATYGSLMPYRLTPAGRTVWISACPARGLPQGRSLESLAEHVRRNTVEFAVRGHKINGESQQLGTLVLDAVQSAQTLAPSYYDPMRNHPAPVTLRPAFLSRIRELAYGGSRRGRGATDGEKF